MHIPVSRGRAWLLGPGRQPAEDALPGHPPRRGSGLGAGPAMAFRRTEGMSMIQALAMTVAEIPVFLYTTLGQVRSGWLMVLP